MEQQWEYIQVYNEGREFAIISHQGELLTEEEYKSIDPKGSKNKKGYWVSGTGPIHFLSIILNKLGAEGWESVGNIYSKGYTDLCILLKRPLRK